MEVISLSLSLGVSDSLVVQVWADASAHTSKEGSLCHRLAPPLRLSNQCVHFGISRIISPNNVYTGFSNYILCNMHTVSEPSATVSGHCS